MQEAVCVTAGDEAGAETVGENSVKLGVYGACRLCTTLCNWLCVNQCVRRRFGKLVPLKQCGVGVGTRGTPSGEAAQVGAGVGVTQSQPPQKVMRLREGGQPWDPPAPHPHCPLSLIHLTAQLPALWVEEGSL